MKKKTKHFNEDKPSALGMGLVNNPYVEPKEKKDPLDKIAGDFTEGFMEISWKGIWKKYIAPILKFLTMVLIIVGFILLLTSNLRST